MALVDYLIEITRFGQPSDKKLEELIAEAGGTPEPAAETGGEA